MMIGPVLSSTGQYSLVFLESWWLAQYSGHGVGIDLNISNQIHLE